MRKLLQDELIRGDDRTIDITIVDSSGRPIDITGGKVYFTLNVSSNPATDAGAALAKSTTSHLDPMHGRTSIDLTHTETDGLPIGPCSYDAQFKDASGKITSKQQGVITVLADITRSTA